MPPTVHSNQLTAPNIIDVVVIKEEVDSDEKLQKIREELEEKGGDPNNKFLVKQGMLIYKDRLVISKTSKLIPMFLHTYHDSVFGGHSGFLRTYKRLTGELYWEGMKQDVKKYCEECIICQRNKTLVLSPVGLLTPLEVPNRVGKIFPWISVKGYRRLMIWKSYLW